MAEFLVTWRIDIDAKCPIEAAQKSLKIQRNHQSEATHFSVRNASTGEISDIDLLDLHVEPPALRDCPECGGSDKFDDLTFPFQGEYEFVVCQQCGRRTFKSEWNFSQAPEAPLELNEVAEAAKLIEGRRESLESYDGIKDFALGQLEVLHGCFEVALVSKGDNAETCQLALIRTRIQELEAAINGIMLSDLKTYG